MGRNMACRTRTRMAVYPGTNRKGMSTQFCSYDYDLCGEDHSQDVGHVGHGVQSIEMYRHKYKRLGLGKSPSLIAALVIKNRLCFRFSSEAAPTLARHFVGYDRWIGGSCDSAVHSGSDLVCPCANRDRTRPLALVAQFDHNWTLARPFFDVTWPEGG